jgi:gluconolactonase
MLIAVSGMFSPFAAAQGGGVPVPPAPIMPPSLPPAHVVNLMTNEGSSVFGAQWRTIDVKIIEVPAGANKGQYKTTYNIEPQAGGANFDDSKWRTVEAKDLGGRRGGGHIAFVWYRALFTMPSKIGSFDLMKPAVVVFNAILDDYGEVWVNGEIPRRTGYPSPATIQGFNMPNRVVLSNAVKAGDKFQIAVFAMNGPISMAPPNSVWFRQALMEFYR